MVSLTRNFRNVKLSPVCFVMVLPYLMALEALENELGVGRYLQGVPMERQLENAQRSYVDQTQRIKSYKEMAVRLYNQQDELQQLLDLIPVYTAADYSVRKQAFETRKIAVQLGPTNGSHPALRQILATWEGDVPERSMNTEYKDDQKNLREDKDKYDKKMGKLLRYVKETTDAEINQLVLDEETRKVLWVLDGEVGPGELRVRPRAQVYTAVKEAITERLRGDAESTRSHIRDMLNDLPKVASYMGLNENLASIEAIRILIERHMERFGGAGA